MNPGILSSASGSLAAMARLDSIANNLANASTSGFKAERFVAHADRGRYELRRDAAVTTPIARGSFATDFAQGSIVTTGSPLDVAINGEGFFVVDTPRGERLTRDGSFSLDAEQNLVGPEGFRVLGDGGPIQLRSGPVAIGSDGTVKVGDETVGKLRIVAVPEVAGLVREGGTLFAPGNQVVAEATPGAVNLAQGAVETANLSPVLSLVSLIETMRAFEAYAQAAERIDKATGQAIDQVGRV